MATAMTEEQALANISTIFHAEFRRLKQTHLQPDENIFAAVDCSSSKHFGFFVVTTYRAILVRFRADRKRQKVRYYKEGGGFFSQTVADERFWFFPSSTPLLESELKDREYREGLLSGIVAVERREYSMFSGGQQLQIVELNYIERDKSWHNCLIPTAFETQTGQTIYNLIQTAIQHGGRIQTRSESDEVISQLERLAILHKTGDLTDEEFSVAKAKLLGL